MSVHDILKHLVKQQDLSFEQMQQVMQFFMAGRTTPAQMGAILTALSIKGETSIEISAAAAVMRSLMLKMPVEDDAALDIAGTGGDGANLFNVSTASSLVTAAAGVTVAKHGNYAVSSSSGSANLLSQAGIHLDMSLEQTAQCIRHVGIGFMFAPTYHPTMRYAVPVRRDLGMRTIFNILGPLTNPAGVKRHLIGVYDEALLPVVSSALRQLGSTHAMVVHSEDGLDEISLAAPTQVALLKDDQIRYFTLCPETVGIARQPLDTLRVHSVEDSLSLIEAALSGQPGPAADIIALNAGAAIFIADKAFTLADGVARAQEVLAQGIALEKLRQLAESSRQAVSTAPSSQGAS